MDSPSESATGILTIIGNNPSSFTDDIIPLSSIGVKVVIVDVFLIFMTIVFTSLRIISRRLRGQKLFPEDYLHIVSMICFQGIGFLSIAMFVRGFGHHIWELQIFHIAPLLKMYYALMILYAISLGLVKISICWSLARIFSTPLLVFGARILMVVSALWAITTIFISIIFCHTIGLDWSMFSTDEHCLNLTVAYGILAAVDVLVDLFILVLPFPTLWSLQMPKSTRVALTFVFSTGILTMSFGILRPLVIVNLQQADVLYSGIMGHVWTVVENGVAIIVSSSPFLRPVFERVAHAFVSFTNITRATTSGKHSTRHTEDERHLVAVPPAAFHGQGCHDAESIELSDSHNRRQTMWPSSSSLGV